VDFLAKINKHVGPNKAVILEKGVKNK